MKNINWREIVEIVGVVSIVGSLLLLAMEVRQSNLIAATEIELQVANMFNIDNIERASNPDYAKLYAKIEDPGSHLITATEQQQIRGLAWFFVNNYAYVQAAYNNGLLSSETYEGLRADFDSIVERHPGLTADFLYIREHSPWIADYPIFEPIIELEIENQ